MRIHKKTLKFKFAVVTMGKPQFIIDSPDSCIKIEDFLPRYTSQSKYKEVFIYLFIFLFECIPISKRRIAWSL